MNLKKIAKWSFVLFSVMLVCFIGDCTKCVHIAFDGRGCGA